MLYSAKATVYSEIHIKHTNAICGRYVALFSVKPDGSYSNRKL